MLSTFPRRVATWVALFIAAVAVTLGGVLATMLVVPPAHANDDATGTLIALTNETRAAEGLPLLASADRMNEIAQGWADHLAETGTLGHNPGVAEQLPDGWSLWGENVAQGSGADAASMQNLWMNSPDHHANIVGPTYTVMGVGYAVTADGTAYGVELFAAYLNLDAIGAKPPEAAPAESEPAAEPAAEEGTSDPEPAPPLEDADAAALAAEQDALDKSPAAAATGAPADGSNPGLLAAAVANRTPVVAAAVASGVFAVMSAALLIVASRRRTAHARAVEESAAANA